MTEQEFFTDFSQNILAQSGAEKNFTRSIFLDHMCSLLESEGLISGYDLTEHKITAARKAQAVDAWSYDDERSCLTLVLADYRTAGTMETLTKTEIGNGYKRLRNFVSSAMDPSFATSLEESDPVAGLAWFMKESRENIEKVLLVLVSNALISVRISELPDESVCNYSTSYDVWDFGRIYRNEISGKTRETVEISFEHTDGAGLPCLPAFTGNDTLKSYLLVMPGSILAKLYDEHGDRLLEQNVRSFLQFRGKINKGIRDTIVNEPNMFFLYNNGLSATAEAVVTNSDESRIKKITNLQIVNGGQTTASIFTAHKKEKADLDKIYVQIKLSVISQELAEEVVPKISEYSNTQNKVNVADFFSNNPFHLRIEELSRRLWAPARAGSVQQTHWFYERIRGQFVNQQATLSPAEKNKFLAKNPRQQMLTKTDLAKFLLSFDQAPNEVSLGAQKAFSGTPQTKGLVGRIASLWDKHDGTDVNEIWFKQIIAKAIMFREVDRIVFRSSWYTGYKANIVTYTIAKLSNMVEKMNLSLDFLDIWDRQCLPEQLMYQLSSLAQSINEVLCNPPQGTTSNISEWAKKKSCWESVKALDLTLTDSAQQLLIDRGQNKEQVQDGRRNQVIEELIKAEIYVFEKGAEYWKKLRDWNRINLNLSTKEVGILNIACSIPKNYPSEKQSKVLMEAEKRALKNGFVVVG